MKKWFSVKTIVAIGVGSALFFVLGRFAAIPSPVPNTNVSTQYALLAFMSVVFGPIAAALIGFIGHTLIDFSYGWGIWWSWVIVSGIFGLVMGLLGKAVKIQNGFGKREIGLFNLFQAVTHGVCWAVLAPLLDILMFAEPANKVFVQGATGAVVNVATTAVLGTILCAAYAAARPKGGSLSKEA